MKINRLKEQVLFDLAAKDREKVRIRWWTNGFRGTYNEDLIKKIRYAKENKH
jgi:hypothetical protein